VDFITDVYLVDRSGLKKDDRGLYTTLDDVNEALGLYAEKIGKFYNPAKTPASTFRLIDTVLREKAEHSELIENKRRFYIS